MDLLPSFPGTRGISDTRTPLITSQQVLCAWTDVTIWLVKGKTRVKTVTSEVAPDLGFYLLTFRDTLKNKTDLFSAKEKKCWKNNFENGKAQGPLLAIMSSLIPTGPDIPSVIHSFCSLKKKSSWQLGSLKDTLPWAFIFCITTFLQCEHGMKFGCRFLPWKRGAMPCRLVKRYRQMLASNLPVSKLCLWMSSDLVSNRLRK